MSAAEEPAEGRIEDFPPIAAESRIQRLVRDYRARLTSLEEVMAAIEAVRMEAVIVRLDELHGRAEAAAAAREALLDAVKRRADLFRKPRSRSILGVKFGWRKLPGRVRTAANTLALIREKLGEKAALLIRTREEVATDRLRDLTGRELAAVGATVTDSTDAAFVAVDAGDAAAAAKALLEAARSSNRAI